MRIGVDYTAGVKQKAGIGRYTREIISHLARIDKDNSYTLLVPADAPVPSGLPGNFRVSRLPLPERLATILWHRLRVPLWVELFTGPLDLFHSPDFVLPPVRAARAILTVHDLSFLRLPWCAEPSLQRYLSRAVRRSVGRADLILADSENTRRDVISLLGVEPERVEVLYAGVGERFRPASPAEKAAVRAKYRLPDRFILSVGTIEPRKNYSQLIRAYALLFEDLGEAAPHLVIAGQKGWLYEEVFSTLEETGLGERVLFAGYVADEDLPALYSAAEVLVFPSFYEGFGLPPLEAMACGTPVVASDAPCLPEVLGDAALFVSPRSPESIASAVRRLLRDEELRAMLREKGFRRAAEFTWDKAAARLKEIYASLGAGR